MGCNCKWTEIIISVVVFLVVMWPALLGSVASKWIAGIAAAVLFVHALWCGNCGTCNAEIAKPVPMPAKKATKKKKRK